MALAIPAAARAQGVNMGMPEAVEAFFERAGEPKVLRWTDTEHVGAGKQDIVEVVLAEIAAYLEETAPERIAGEMLSG